MKAALIVSGLAAAVAFVATQPRATVPTQPRTTVPPKPHLLPYFTNVTLTNFDIVFPDAFYETNYQWYFEIADVVTGPWSLPDRQHIDDSHWFVHRHGAQFIRMHGNPY